MKYEMKGCPFCGGKARLHESGNKVVSHWYNVICNRCDVWTGQHQHPLGAIEAWNKRKQQNASEE